MIKSAKADTIHIESEKPANVSYESLTNAIASHPVRSPVKHNSCASLVEEQHKPSETIVEYANLTQPIIDGSILKLILEFLHFKREHGSPIEQSLYKDISTDAFITRLLLKRPFAFLGSKDHYLLRNGDSGNGGFENIGSVNEKSPLILTDYLSYDEMQLSALLCVATPSYLINNGKKNNQGVLGKPGTFQESGLIIGMVGTRCEVPERNEYAHMLITPKQNTTLKGYGKDSSSELKRQHAHWAKFYSQGNNDDFYFPSFQEAIKDKSGKYAIISENKLLNVAVYKQRLKAVIAPFLISANEYGSIMHKEVYIEVGRLGLGSWAVAPSIQTPLQLEVYAELLSELSLHHIKTINFGRFLPEGESILHDLITKHQITKANPHLKIQCIEREPAQKLPPEDENKLLVINYAWDGNSYPGNEYWLNMLSASTDPATACYTQIAELQNPLINPNVSGASTYVALKSGLVPIQQFNNFTCPQNYKEMDSLLSQQASTKSSKSNRSNRPKVV